MIQEVETDFIEYKKKKQSILKDIQPSKVYEDAGKAAQRFQSFCNDPSYKRAYDLSKNHKVSRITTNKLKSINEQYTKISSSIQSPTTPHNHHNRLSSFNMSINNNRYSVVSDNDYVSIQNK